MGAMNSSQNRYRMSCKPDGSIYDRLAFAGAGTHPSEAIANLAMSTRGFQLRWGRLGASKEDRTSSPPWSGVG